MSQDSVKSLLCANTWHWDSREEMQIVFEADGTGKLICRSELNLWIATMLEWKVINPEPLEEPLEDTPKHFSIQIALTRHDIPKLGSVDTSVYRRKNGDVLTDDAFSLKTYSLTMERGRFRTSCDQIENPTRELDYELKYGLRLTFDVSPYPPREEWKEPSGAPDAFKFWEMKIFCGGKLEL